MVQSSLYERSQEKNHDSMESLAACAKSLCLQGEFGRAAKILSLDGVAPDNKERLKEVMNLHPAKKVPPSENDDYCSYSYQFDEASVFTAAGPSKMYTEKILHAVTCTVPD